MREREREIENIDRWRKRDEEIRNKESKKENCARESARF